MSDHAARERAAHGYDRNLVVVAGAGSGKTSLLVERIVCQMVERDLAHDAFAAITFTEKAAAEMRRRLETALVSLAAHAEADRLPMELDLRKEADRAYAWLRERVTPARIGERARRAVHALADVEVTTIHGFCARLLRSHPIEAGIGPDFRVDTGDRIEELVDELWERFLAGRHGVDGPLRSRFAHVLERLGLGELESLARAAASFAIPDAALAAPLPDMQRVFGRWADRTVARIESLVSDRPGRGRESWLSAARAPLQVLRDSDADAYQRSLDETQFAAHQGMRGLMEGSPPGNKVAPEVEALFKEVYGRFDKLRCVDDSLLEEALDLVRPFAREVRAEAQRSGLLPFDALLSLARDVLATHPRVREEVGERYRVLFLDEFQDTDPLQYEIVFLVSGGAGGAPRQGSLFIVGDPKQAIYRFRGADISAYESAVGRILAAGGEQLVLTANFRSRPEVLEPLDRLFRLTFGVRPDEDESLPSAYVSYDGLEASRDRKGRPCVERWRIGEAAAARDSRELEADVIAGWIAAEAAAGEFRFGQVALLLRALTDAHVYVRALQQRGIPVWVGRAEEPEREPALQQVTSLLRALANPADAPAVIGFLRSPLGGARDAELATHATRNGGRWLYTTVTPDRASVPNLARAFMWLRDWRARVEREPLAEVLAALRDGTPLLGLHAGARDGVRRLVDLTALLDRLTARAAAAPDRDLVRLVTALEREEQRRASEEPVPESDAVRVLSIHAAKGLEFDVVVLPDLARGTPPNYGDARGVTLRPSPELGALAVYTRAALSSSWVARERIEKVHADAELRRLLYVGATRAKERLVFAEARRNRRATADTFGGLLADWTEDSEVVEREMLVPALAPVPGGSAVTSDSTAALERTAAAAARARNAASPALSRPSGLSEEDEGHAAAGADRDESLPSRALAAQARARAVGTALHELLERWDLRSRETARSLLRSAVTRASRVFGAVEADVLAEADSALDSLLDSKLPQILASVHILGRELPLLFRDSEGRAWSGTIDLLYRDPEDGGLVVADYKTDKHPDNESRERYRAQLAVYARGVERLFPGEAPPRLELVWLRSGQRERLPLESPA